jgi:hypothetical protein
MKTEHVATFYRRSESLDYTFGLDLLRQTQNSGSDEHELWILDYPYDSDVRLQWNYCPSISEIHRAIEKIMRIN